MPSIPLSLTTKISPAEKFEVEGKPFLLSGLEHLSPDDEAEVLGIFAQYDQLGNALLRASSRDKVKRITLRLRALRVEILERITDMPRDLCEKLPLTQQVLLLERFGNQGTVERDEDGLPENDEDDLDPGEPTEEELESLLE